MYKKNNSNPEFENFYLPFGGKLQSDNRWINLAKLIPWDKIEDLYKSQFSETGAPAKNLRVALGALIIKEKLKLTDEETVEQIMENPYMQYFIGMEEYRYEQPFDSSMMVHFRKRLNLEILNEINELIQNKQKKKKQPSKGEDSDDPPNEGKLIADATCAPADIKYPTDVSLLNEAREKAEKIIDTLHGPLIGKEEKVRTYRNKARKDYLKFSKKRRHTRKEVRKAVRKQLGYLGRNLIHIENLVKKNGLHLLSKRQYRNLLVIRELYRQQKEMYDGKIHTTKNRIVSIAQPHVRPIVRGKVATPVEFGAKLSISIVDGFSYLDHLSWENYNESTDLIDQIESYKTRFGFYPNSVHVDSIYRTKTNRKYCKDKEIRMSGPSLGRPKKENEQNKAIIREKKRLARQDELDRNAVEGKFGQGKRRYNLNRIMAKLASTSEVTIGIIFMIMNLDKILREVSLRQLLYWHRLVKSLIVRVKFVLCNSINTIHSEKHKREIMLAF